MRRLFVIAAAVLLVAIGCWYLFLRTETVTPTLTVALPVATIGSGEGAVGVAPDGTILAGGKPPAEALPELPLSKPPAGGRLAGPALEQVRVLAAAPAPLRPCIAATHYGETGVAVELGSGIELYFGSAAHAAEKWSAAAAVLADPSITALDYVDLHVPSRPDVGGSGHTLPSAEEAPEGGCGE